MSKDEALKLALEEMKIGNYNSAAERLEAALANHIPDATKMIKQEQGEPVAWVNHGENRITRATGWDGYGALYTKQQQRKPLTDEQIEAGASALVDSCIAKGHWAHVSDESKRVYLFHAKAVLTAAHSIKE